MKTARMVRAAVPMLLWACGVSSCLGIVGCVMGLCACGGASDGVESKSVRQPPVQGGVVEFSLQSFDGEELKGRVLVGTTGEAFVVDARLIEEIDVELREVKTCDTVKALGHYRFDLVVEPARPEQLVHVKKGYWYGGDVRFLLFSERRLGFLPDCFRANLMVWGQGGRLVGTLPIEVRRTAKGAAGEKPGS